MVAALSSVHAPSIRVRHAVRLDRLRVDLRPEEVVDAHAVRARAVERRVDRVLVRPRGSQAGVVDHLEDRVDPHVVPRLDRLAGLRVDRVRRRVQARLRVRAELHDQGRIGVNAARVDRAALIERREGVAAPVVQQVRHGGQLVVGRVVDDVAAGDRPGAVRRSRREDAVAVLVVVVDAGDLGVAAGHDPRAARRRSPMGRWSARRCTRRRRWPAARAPSRDGGRRTSSDRTGACRRPISAAHAGCRGRGPARAGPAERSPPMTLPFRPGRSRPEPWPHPRSWPQSAKVTWALVSSVA